MLNTIRFARRTVARALCVVALAAAAPAAAIPDVVTWAARVENDAGAFNGTMTATFELFDGASGGTALWTEIVPSAIVVNGDLVHELGSVEPLDDSIIDRDNLFLQVTLNDDRLAPRTALRAVPYAIRSTEAGHADEATHAVDATTLAGLAAASFQFTAGAGLRLAGTVFAINSAGVVTTMIADGAVTSAKIAAGAVTATQLGDSAVVAAKIGGGAVTVDKIGTGAVTTDKLASAAVTSSKIAASSITSTAIADGVVGAADLASNAVTEAKISGTMIEVFTRPNGCGGGIQIGNTSCLTLLCDVDDSLTNVLGQTLVDEVSHDFRNCAGTSCESSTSLSCPVGPAVGKLLPVSF